MKKKKRFIVLACFYVILIISCFIVINTFGSTYRLRTAIGFLENSKINSLTVKFSNDNVLEYTGYDFDDVSWSDKELVVDFKSVGSGKTDVTILYDGNDTDENAEYNLSKYSFHVNPFGTIIETTNGTNFTAYKYVIFSVFASLTVTIAVMGWSFIESIRKAQFSYSMIAYGGLGLFSAALLTFLIYKFMNNVIKTMYEFTGTVNKIGEEFVFITMPLMLIMAISVSISNIWLMKNEGFRPVNGLGIAISVLWLAGTLITTRIVTWNLDAVDQSIVILIRFILVYILCYFECMLLSTTVCAAMASKYKPEFNKDYIIILGCAIRNDGSLTPLLKGRTDSAVNFEKTQYEKTGKHAVFVPSGGQGSDEVISEGEAMERYLIENGIPAERILREDKSVNTYQNFDFSKKIIDNNSNESKDVHIAFATTNYHIFRGYILSKKLGFYAQGISAKTKWYFFPNAFIREFIGLLFDKKWYHILFILATILFFFSLILL